MSEKSKDNWRGIAVAGIWIGTGLSAFGMGLGAVLLGFFAWMATDSIMGIE